MASPEESAPDADAILARCQGLIGRDGTDENPFEHKYAAQKELEALQRALAPAGLSAALGRTEAMLGLVAMETEDFGAADARLSALLRRMAPAFEERMRTAGDGEEAPGLPARADLEEGEWSALGALPAVSVDCLNMLGVLWSHREVPRRSLLFLLAAKEVARRAGAVADGPAPGGAAPARLAELLTHTVFYLAQAYANLGDADRGARYAQLTLEQQLRSGSGSGSGSGAGPDAREWVRNCLGLYRYCRSRGRLEEAARCLGACHCVLGGSSVQTGSEAWRAPLLAELLRAKGRLLLDALAAAADLAALGRAPERSESAFGPQELRFEGLGGLEAALEAEDLRPPPPEDVCAGGFEAAREVFRRSCGALRAGMEGVPLEGFVTEHVRARQDLCALYRELMRFEGDAKRRCAMLKRRSEEIAPLLRALGARPFAHLHKEIAFDVGRIHSEVVDFRARRVEERQSPDGSKAPRKSDVDALNAAASAAIAAFRHFAALHRRDGPAAGGGGPGGGGPGFRYPAEDAAALPLADGAWSPPLSALLDESFVAPGDAFEGGLGPGDVGPLWRCHFHAARMWGRAVASSPQDRVAFLRQALLIYEALPRLAESLVAAMDAAGGPAAAEDLFGEELHICRQMADLLPARISRLHHEGAAAARGGYYGPAL